MRHSKHRQRVQGVFVSFGNLLVRSGSVLAVPGLLLKAQKHISEVLERFSPSTGVDALFAFGGVRNSPVYLRINTGAEESLHLLPDLVGLESQNPLMILKTFRHYDDGSGNCACTSSCPCGL
jgi:hypothetical protein